MEMAFKYTLVVLLFLSAFFCLADVGKGEYMEKQKPLTKAIAAAVSLLLGIGVLVWL